MIDNYPVRTSILFLQMQFSIHIINRNQDLFCIQIINANLKTSIGSRVWIDLDTMFRLRQSLDLFRIVRWILVIDCAGVVNVQTGPVVVD